MTKNKKIIIAVCIIVVIVIIIALIGWSNKSASNNADLASGSINSLPPYPSEAVPTSLTENEIEESVLSENPDIALRPETVPSDAKEALDTVEYPDQKVILEYFDVETNSMQSDVVSVPVNDSNLQFILEAVSQKFFGQPLDQSPIQPNSMQWDAENLYIDFNAKISNSDFGSSGDAMLLDAIYYGYTKNISGIKNIFFSIDDDDFITGHLQLSKKFSYQPIIS